MVQRKNQFVPANLKQVSRGKNNKVGVTVHQTGNTSRGADAQAHANLQSRAGMGTTSWHWTVDDKIAIRSYRHNDRCHHSGTARGNSSFIAVEICVNSDADYEKAVQNGAELVAWVLKQEGLKIGDVVQHNAHSGKDCPTQIRRGDKGINWSKFLDLVRAELGGSGSSNSSSSGSSSKSSSSSSGSSSSRKTTAQLVDEVSRGLHGNGDARKRSLGSRYQEVQNAINRAAGVSSAPRQSTPAPARKTTAQLVDEVNRGLHGNGDARKRSLGSRYQEVQNAINRGVRGSSSRPSAPRKTTAQLVDEVNRGLHGNGDARKRSLGSRYQEVQNEINRRAR